MPKLSKYIPVSNNMDAMIISQILTYHSDEYPYFAFHLDSSLTKKPKLVKT